MTDHDAQAVTPEGVVIQIGRHWREAAGKDGVYGALRKVVDLDHVSGKAVMAGGRRTRVSFSRMKNASGGWVLWNIERNEPAKQVGAKA